MTTIRPLKWLLAVLFLLVSGLARLPMEHAFAKELKTAELSEERLNLSLRDELGQSFFIAVLGGFLGPAEPANTCIAGRSDTVGRPLLYGTTDRFLDQFALASLDELPRPREIDELLADPRFARERADLLATTDPRPDATPEQEEGRR